MNKRNILTLQETCSGCFACANVCPKDAITLPENKEGFYFPQIDNSKCIDCGLCDKTCPVLNPIKTQTTKQAFYGYSMSDVVRMKSTSGGIFGLLAKLIIDNGGLVYGAAFNYGDNLRLEHFSSSDVPMSALQRSKYVQSYIGDTYTRIKKDLLDGREVLFCGTPCQAAGLKSFLGKEYDNLLIIDFVCHGVPSMNLLNQHIKYVGIKNVKEIIFRSKTEDWIGDFEIYYQKDNHKKIKVRKQAWGCDEYLNLFQKYLSMRRSCRYCLYCNGNRASDISLADFWGYQKFDTSIWDRKGISLILSNTDKGLSFVSKIKDAYKDIVIEDLPMQYSSYVYKRIRTDADSSYSSPVRDKFFADLYSFGYPIALKLNGLDITRKEKMLFLIKRYLKKILKR